MGASFKYWLFVRPSKSAMVSPRRVQKTLRRSGVQLFTAAVLAVQAASCVSPPDLGQPSIIVGKAGMDAVIAAARFAACPQFFAGGVAPSIVTDPKTRLRALCYENFAVLHDGASKTPLFVAKRLNLQILLAAEKQARLSRFHAEGLLPPDGRAEPGDCLDSGYAQDGAAGKRPATVCSSNGAGLLPVMVYFHGGGRVIADHKV